MKKILSIALSLVIMTLSIFGCDTGKKHNKPQIEPYPEANPAADFEYAVHPEENYAAITKYIGTAKDVVIPQAIDDCPVKMISPVSFAGTDITSVTMPDSVIIIGDFAFQSCLNLETVKFSKNLQVIDTEAFEYCISLREAILPSSLERIGSNAFYKCTALKTVKLPKNLNDWRGEVTFGLNTGLRTIIIEDGIEVIGSSMGFANCFTLEEIVFPASVTKLSGAIFSGCTMLNKVVFLGDAPEIDLSGGVAPFGEIEDLVIYYDSSKKGWDTTDLKDYYTLEPLTEGADITPNEAVPSKRWEDFEYESVSGECGITKYIGASSEVEIPKTIDGMPVSWIGRAAFSYSNVEKISMPSSIARIEGYAFTGCSNLKEIELSENISVLDEAVFKECISLNSIDLSKITEIKSDALMYCGLESITIPKTLEKWTGSRMFFGNSNLQSIVFEDGIKSVGSYLCFTNLRSLTEITFPSSVETISGGSFLNCPSLTKVTFFGDAPSIDNSNSAGTPFDERDTLTIYYDPNSNGWDTTPLKDNYNLEPMSIAALTAAQKQEIEDFLNDPSNEAYDALYNDDDVKKIAVLGGEIVGNDRYVITCARILEGVFQDVGIYTVTLIKTENGYILISNIRNDSEMIRSSYEKALNAHQIDPENERNIGDELCEETMAVCRMDDGKYYQILSISTYDMVFVLVSNNELKMSPEWDWIPIGEKDTCSMENMGKIEDLAK